MAINGVRFGHVAFKVSDVEKSIRWYGDAFGATVIYRVAPSGDRPELMFLEFSKGQCVELFPGGKNMLASPPDPIGYIHFCLVIDNLEQALEHLAKMNVKPERKFIGRAKQKNCVHFRSRRQQHRADGNPAGVGNLSDLSVRDTLFAR